MTTPRIDTAPARLIASLRDPVCYPHRVDHIDVLETHISWVILTGPYAYKFKKPVNLGFLDFTTLEARRHYCEQELTLNRRLAPSLYEAVVPIGGSAAHPVIGGDGPAVEYAVRMREFPQSALASRMLTQGDLTHEHLDAFAVRLAAFHATTGVAARNTPHGSPDAIMACARDNFTALERLLPDAADQTRLGELRAWTEQEYQSRRAWFGERHAQGFVRECHGDLHLANIVMLEGELTPFDCIEFDAALRWIDVMNEVAFLAMDLMDRGRVDYAYRFLNGYLEASGDYGGLAVLRFYRVYRALVRAKVHALRAAQAGLAAAERARLTAAARGYLTLALRCTQDTQAAMILMHGFSGSGKSVVAQSLASELGAIRVRSDIERKRIAGLTPQARSGSELASGIYTVDLTDATYQRLLDLARLVTQAGYAAIVDATFIKRWQRDLFRRQAQNQGIPFIIVDVTAPEGTLRARITARLRANKDVSEADPAVLAHQIAAHDALTAEESPAVLRIDTARGDVDAVLHTIQRETCAALRARLAPPGATHQK